MVESIYTVKKGAFFFFNDQFNASNGTVSNVFHCGQQHLSHDEGDFEKKPYVNHPLQA